MSADGASSSPEPTSKRIERLLKATPLIDGHNDFPFLLRQQLHHQIYEHDLRDNLDCHTSVKKMRQGMMGGQFWSIYVPNPEEARLVVPDDNGDNKENGAATNGYHMLKSYEKKHTCGCEHIPANDGRQGKGLGLNEPNVSDIVQLARHVVCAS
jgi:hypothetical protein